VEVQDGKISRIDRDGPAAGALGDESLVIAPAFIDVQVNGVAGRNVNAANVTAEEIAAIPSHLHASGAAMFCPTVTTGSAEQMTRSLKAIAGACRDPKVAHAIPGIHVEGPYISAEDGPRGAHVLQYVRDPDWDEFQRFQEAAEGRIKILTLAPERAGAIPFISKVAASGVIVSLGHTAAEPMHIDAAVKAGARMSTHLGNGAHARLPRHPNYIWEQLSKDELWMGFIADGHHLPPAVVKCFVRAKGLDRSVLVSDAVALAGLPPGRYAGEAVFGLGDPREVDVSPEGKISLAGTPYLAGAGLLIHRCVENIPRFCGLPLSDAIRLASLNPARLLGIQDRAGSVEVGRSADLTLLRWDADRQTLRVEATMVQGEVVWSA
jgi:N-acetylglucosamine-6-phosphate deacetylase